MLRLPKQISNWIQSFSKEPGPGVTSSVELNIHEITITFETRTDVTIQLEDIKRSCLLQPWVLPNYEVSVHRKLDLKENPLVEVKATVLDPGAESLEKMLKEKYGNLPPKKGINH